MKYVLMIGSDVSAPPEVLESQQRAGCGGWSEEMEARGVVRGGAGLRPSSEATTVRVREGRLLRTDGPFAETKDQIGGFVVIECADLEEAVEIAAKHPSARFGQIEIRPVWEP
ncbi:YciI family protein [Nonomuraea sp. NPDC059194]|uniref:YciI family protein n=1 Tax=Nonomuraea sp. NPDC059194 TaxID=3346764 RepID=UPI003683BF0B